MQQLIQFISQRTFLSPGLTARIQNDFQYVDLKKGDTLLESDRTARHLYFIDQGVLHNFYLHDGKQVSSWFYTHGQFITAWYSFYSRNPSFESIECLSDCRLLKISYDDYQKLIVDFPAFGNFARLLAEEILVTIDEFSKSWSFLTAREKYNKLLEYFPDVELHIKLGQIASFLGISQETLSRLRSKK